MQTKHAICLVFIYFFCFNMSISVSSTQEDKSLEKYYIGNALYNKGLYSLAINNYTTFIEQYPNSPKFLHAKLGLALSYYGMGQFNRAKQIFEELSDNEKAPQQELIHKY